MDRYAYQSKLRYMNATQKVCYSLGSLLICIGFRSVLCALFVLFVNTLWIVGIGKTPFYHFIKALMIPVSFLLLSTLTIVINFSKEPLNAFAAWIGFTYITASIKGIYFALQLFFTALASVSSLYVLSFTTPMTDVIACLRKFHVPELFLELMLLIYRFIFVLNTTATSILTAQKARLSNRNYKRAMHAFGEMGGALFIKAMKRSNALYDAMEARCYDGRIHVLTEEIEPKKVEIIIIVGLLFLYLLISLL